MRRPEWILLTGALATAVVVGCSSTPSTSTSTSPTSVVSGAPTPVQITRASLGSNDATVTVQDTGTQPLSLSGWTLMVGSTPVQLPSSATIPAGQSLTLHTAAGTNTATDLYLSQNTQAIASSLQPGTQVALQSPTGSTVASFTVPNS